MPTRNVVLTDHHERLIESLVGNGRYQNASEVLREGLRLVEQREAEDAAKIEAFRAAVQEGVDAIERGDYVEFKDSASMRAYLMAVADEALASDEDDAA